MSLNVPIDTSTMSLDEKAKSAEISPVSTTSDEQKPAQGLHQEQATTHAITTSSPTPTPKPNTPSLSGLDGLVVLPKILQEGILFVASGPALLLQAAHPAVATPNTNLSKNLTASLHATLSYIACLVFGNTDEKAALLGRIRLGQAPLKSSAQGENVATPAAQLWIVATLYATATDFFQRIWGNFDYRTAESAYDEFSLVLRHLSPTVLPHEANLWPSTRTEFWKYWDAQLDSLVVSAAAQDVAKDLSSRPLPSGTGVTRPLLRAVTVEMLPEKLREGYGLKSSAASRGVYSTTMGLIKPIYPCIPKAWRKGPMKYYLGEVRGGISS